MSREYKLQKVEPDDPRRCQGITKTGQCPFRVDQDSNGNDLKFCGMHKAGIHTTIEDKNIRNYRLTKFRAQIEEKADSGAIKSLREEIGITRQVLETFINRCEDETDLMIHSNKISDLVIKIEKLVSSCHRLERSTGQLLDKTAIIQVAGMFSEVIGEYVSEDIQAEISQRLIDIIQDVEMVDADE